MPLCGKRTLCWHRIPLFNRLWILSISYYFSMLKITFLLNCAVQIWFDLPSKRYLYLFYHSLSLKTCLISEIRCILKIWFYNVHAVFDKFSITEKFTAPFKYWWILMPFGIYHIGCIIRHLKHVSVHGDTQGRIGPTHAFWPFWGYFSYSIIANCTGLILSQVSETFSRFFCHHCATFFC